MRERGVYVHRRHMLRGFVGAGHKESDIDRTVDLVGTFLKTHRDALAAA
jgi:glutamate-1-semialdehyde aminotransferase